ncbi:anti-sigma factor family protein [Azospirillum thermophilum]|uniref:Anti-sigma factor n=1 Tax=Azospirillum thermophilum TaxID=2202148 RepID=A0A2S2CTZ8_9PROT|nr:anti-sigma factor [Azospirillum thermophilum]AWK87949.1 hypothetical protein DEW08_09830 [Azospirillum thermophilum]
MEHDELDADLHAYVDGELNPARRIEFEAYLAANPAAAARVHDFLHQKEALRRGLDLLSAAPSAPVTSLTDRLGRHLGVGLALRRLGPIAAMLLLVTGGWSLGSWYHGHHASGWAAVPAFADEAAEAHSATLAAVPLPVAPSADDLKAMADVLAQRIGGKAIDLPDVDPNLTLVRARLVPWNEGPALQFVYREPDGEVLTLFVVVGDSPGDIGLHTVEQDNLQLVYWRAGTAAYTVTGNKADRDLLTIARRMADSVRRS